MLKPLFAAMSVTISLTGPVSALSCFPATLPEMYQAASDSSASYVLAHGTLSRTGPDRAAGRADEYGGQPYTLAARFDGDFAGTTRFVDQAPLAVTVSVTCIIGFCGHPPLGTPALLFLRQAGSGYVFDADPCPAWSMLTPSAADLSQAISCAGGGC